MAVSVAVKTLIVCYYGNEVTIESESLTTVCFHAHVRVWDRSFHRALLMMIKKTQEPIQIAAGNFVPISLSTFIWIIRSSYSYFAVLRSRNDAISS
ncbi:odorant receptor 94a-like [Photinus pyralis]|uniref:odorant receptor 94a-like n=1 Tax=Photinus pyralis TaxID=7054 RepID=UPI001267800E|nr:odorant receptor 94a-like [Photinus pyralis]